MIRKDCGALDFGIVHPWCGDDAPVIMNDYLCKFVNAVDCAAAGYGPGNFGIDNPVFALIGKANKERGA